MFNEGNKKYVRKENISDAMLEKFRKRYSPHATNHSPLTKEDIFYYVYSILHSPSYRERFAADLKKQLPRIPMGEDFWTFSEAGRKLAALHLNYESGEMYPLEEVANAMKAPNVAQRSEGINPPNGPVAPRCYAPGFHYTVTQMKFPSKTDKSRIIYNSHLTLVGIPAEAYRYVVNGKSALDWIMERYAVKTDKDSGIVNDPNDWCAEQDNPRYIVDLIKRVVHLSVESVKIIDGLPRVEV